MRFIPVLFILLSSGALFSQQTINASIMHDGLQRDYILYVPAIYDAENAAPLIMNFHGYTSNALEQFFYSDFRPIADTAGFLIVHPQGTTDQLGNPHWNVGWGLSSVNDVSFVAALIDSLSAVFNINQDRVYSTGMSNGGFFSYKLACELSERIAAIASVTGSISRNQLSSCAPGHPIPVMEIHGTADATVPYEGNIIFEPISTVIAYWKNFNNTNTVADSIQIPDTDASDGCTAEHYIYDQGTNGSSIEHFKIINGQHTWPGSAFGGVGTNQDINASKEIWRFFSKYDIHGLINTTSAEEPDATSSITLYPNPAISEINIHFDQHSFAPYQIINMMGQIVLNGKMENVSLKIDISLLPAGIYVLVTEGHAVKFSKL